MGPEGGGVRFETQSAQIGHYVLVGVGHGKGGFEPSVAFDHVGQHETGHHRLDDDPTAPQLVAQIARELVNKRLRQNVKPWPKWSSNQPDRKRIWSDWKRSYFGGAIERAQRRADSAGDGSDVDDDTPAASEHSGQDHVSHPRDGDDVAGDEIVDDLLAADLGEGLAEIVAHAHVVDEDADVQIGQFCCHLPVDGRVTGEVNSDDLDLDWRFHCFCVQNRTVRNVIPCVYQIIQKHGKIYIWYMKREAEAEEEGEGEGEMIIPDNERGFGCPWNFPWNLCNGRVVNCYQLSLPSTSIVKRNSIILARWINASRATNSYWPAINWRWLASVSISLDRRAGCGWKMRRVRRYNRFTYRFQFSSPSIWLASDLSARYSAPWKPTVG